MSLVCWDTMLFIYWFEGHPRFGDRVETIFHRMEERKDLLSSTVFTVGEILVATYRKADIETAQKFRSFFQPPSVRILPFTPEAAVRYAQIRAGMNVSPADAIQLACAAEARVDLFLTNDRALIGKQVPGIQFIAGLDLNLY